MKLRLEQGLLLISIEVVHQNQTKLLERVLIDTGSMATVLSALRLAEIGLVHELEDTLYTMFGVGGSEIVFGKTIEQIRFANTTISNVKAQLGAMDYGIDLDGIIGLDTLMSIGAQLDLHLLELHAFKDVDH